MNDWKRADEIYARIKNKLKGQEGKIVAIDVDSGDYFVGEDTMEACDKGHQKYPGRQFHLMRIGYKAVYFIGAVPS